MYLWIFSCSDILEQILQKDFPSFTCETCMSCLNKSPRLYLNISNRGSVRTVKDPHWELFVLCVKFCSLSAKCWYLLKILISFLLDKYAEMTLLVHMADAFLMSWGSSVLFFLAVHHFALLASTHHFRGGKFYSWMILQ